MGLLFCLPCLYSLPPFARHEKAKPKQLGGVVGLCLFGCLNFVKAVVCLEERAAAEKCVGSVGSNGIE